MIAATERQLAYIEVLKAKRIQEGVNEYKATGRLEGRMRGFAKAALVVNLPTPANSTEASAQIDVLKSDSILIYAKETGYGTPVVKALALKYGSKLEKVPENWDEVVLKVEVGK